MSEQIWDMVWGMREKPEGLLPMVYQGRVVRVLYLGDTPISDTASVENLKAIITLTKKSPLFFVIIRH